jgi:hypothetical protein
MTPMNERDTNLGETAVAVGSMRPWAVKALTILLFIQAAGMLAASVYNFLTLDLDTAGLPVSWLALITSLLANSMIFAALALLALLASLAFFGLWRSGWLVAMLAQGLTLAVALILYFRGHYGYVYLVMLYAIFMVLYLHHPDVVATFHVAPTRSMPEEGDG